MLSFLTRFVAISSLVALAPLAQATVYGVTSVLNGGGGFSASVLHTSNASNPMTGTVFATFDTATGTYDSSTGALDVTFHIVGQTGDGVRLRTTTTGFQFDGAGVQSNNVTTDLNLLQSAGGYATGIYNVIFSSGQQCCGTGGNPFPNSLVSGTGDNLIFSLWGAGTNTSGTRIGTDIQLELTPVPIPAAALLFGTGLLSLLGLRKMKAGQTV